MPKFYQKRAASRALAMKMFGITQIFTIPFVVVKILLKENEHIEEKEDKVLNTLT